MYNIEKIEEKELTGFKEKFSNITSFGNKTLQQNIEEAEKDIQELKYTERIWDRSRSQFMLKYLTCNTSSDWRNLRQVSAEIARKRQALKEAQYSFLKKKAEAEVKREESENESGAKKKLLEIEAEELESNAMEMAPKVEGALKEVKLLKELHDNLKEKVGEVTEEQFEKEEAKSNIKKVFAQSIRDYREMGKIKTGNQEFMDQIGISVSSAEKDIIKFLENERESENINNSLLNSFLEQVAEKYEPVVEINASLLGYEDNVNSELTFNGEE